jgi:UDP-glucose 4-epimerase
MDRETEMKYVVTGAAGFIGSTLAERLLSDGHLVVGVDNLSTGFAEFLHRARQNPQFRFFERDLLHSDALDGLLGPEIDCVFHLAANADVKEGLSYPRKDLEQNTIVTWNVLDALRRDGVKRIAFSSTGSVYGEAQVIPTPEDCPFPIQTSLYGASKLAAEALISAYAEGYGLQGLIFRFVSILGERYTHGHVFDFVRKLQQDPNRLTVLGNGQQKKSYLYVGDCVDAMLTALAQPRRNPVEVYNLGTDEYVTVDQSIDVICDELKVSPKRQYSGGDRGWVGDNPFIFLDCKKMRSIGWQPGKSIRESVRLTTRYVLNNLPMLEARR